MKKNVMIGLIGIFAVLIVFAGFFIFSNTSNQSENSLVDSQTNSKLDQVVSGETKEFNILAKQWQFSPGEIEVNKGDKVILNIKSIDVTHGVAIPNFGINEVLSPGKEVRIEFIADKEGTFYFSCSVSCGAGHSGMRGKIVVN